MARFCCAAPVSDFLPAFVQLGTTPITSIEPSGEPLLGRLQNVLQHIWWNFERRLRLSLSTSTYTVQTCRDFVNGSIYL